MNALNYDSIVKADGSSSYSHGIQILLALMYSFFDSEDGQKLLEKAGTSNFVDAQAILDLDARSIISQLCLDGE